MVCIVGDIIKATELLHYSDTSSSQETSYEIDIDPKYDNQHLIGRAIAEQFSSQSKASHRRGFNRRLRNIAGFDRTAKKKIINVFTIPDFTTSAQTRFVGRNTKEINLKCFLAVSVPTIYKQTNFRCGFRTTALKIILILTSRRDRQGRISTTNFYRSEDNGATFARSWFFEKILIQRWDYNYESPNQLVMIDARNRRRIYVSRDIGKTFTTRTLDFSPAVLRFRTDANIGNYVTAYDSYTKKLYVSRDISVKWNLIDDRVRNFHWSTAKSGSNIYKVYYEYLNADGFSTRIRYCNTLTMEKGDLDPQMTDAAPGNLLVVGKFVMTLVNDVNTSRPLLYVSQNDNPFRIAHFPSSLAKRRFHVIISGSDEIIIAINHQSNLTNLYISDESGTYFTLAIKNIYAASDLLYRLGYSFLGFASIASMPGTYIVSQVKRPAQGLLSRPSLVSLISFNKGGTWHPIIPPKKDRFGNPINCRAPCSLHLDVLTGDFLPEAALYSSSTAPGLIMGIGNYGKELTSVDRAIYISYDGGATWVQSAHYYRIYTALNHGSIILASGRGLQRNTVNVSYSCNSGQTFTDIQVANLTLNTLHLGPAQPDTNSLLAVVLSHDMVSGWVFATLNFRSVLSRECNNNDYIEWYPYDLYDKKKCLLGARYSYRIRKFDSCCYNKYSYSGNNTITPCLCTKEDFQCNYGFEIQSDGTCTVIAAERKTCLNDSTFTEVAYRKTPGNKCKGGIETEMLRGKTYWCKTLQVKSDAGLTYSLAIGVPALILIVAILIYIQIRRNRTRIYYDNDSGLIAPSKLEESTREK
ncbi:VPS10 domain-containing receptor SorCS1 [Trichoplax sp. H2]|nr:VPS10 domain-containing receptor SorCS1 [Trichoplax sp. H2]|eukprot:RDD42759.1 VPS10 domain-containing receptor SorCS1 [Trichoplax sp. H2]